MNIPSQRRLLSFNGDVAAPKTVATSARGNSIECSAFWLLKEAATCIFEIVSVKPKAHLIFILGVTLCQSPAVAHRKHQIEAGEER